jgi:hypothetical protein
VQPSSEGGVLLADGLGRADVDQPDVHRGGHGVSGADRLGEVVTGVEEDDVHAGRNRAGEMGQHHVLHRTRDAEATAEGVDGPLQWPQRRNRQGSTRHCGRIR